MAHQAQFEKPGASANRNWYALKVRANGESTVCSSLERRGLEVFLPTYLEVRKYSDRLKKIQASLFPGYLFARLNLEDQMPALTTPGVDSIVSIAGRPQPLEDSEIVSIRRVVAASATTQPWPYLRSGDTVRIQFGALAGLEGVLINTKGADRLILSVHLLQRSISVDIERDWIRPVQTVVLPSYSVSSGL